MLAVVRLEQQTGQVKGMACSAYSFSMPKLLGMPQQLYSINSKFSVGIALSTLHMAFTAPAAFWWQCPSRSCRCKLHACSYCAANRLRHKGFVFFTGDAFVGMCELRQAKRNNRSLFGPSNGSRRTGLRQFSGAFSDTIR